MKKLLLYLLLFFSFQISFSQSYVAFPTQIGAQWREYFEWNYGGTNQSICEKRIYTIVGDTILDSMNYQVVEERFNRNSSTFQNCSVLTPSSANDSIYLRNDTANKKVWIRFDGSNPDSLLYDFDLKTGDTMYCLIRYWNSSSCFDVVLDSIDTVSYGGIQRRRFNFKSIGFGNQIKPVIEGIGSTLSLLNPFFEGYGWAYSNLKCFSTPTQKIFPDSSTSCRLITDSKKEYLVDDEVAIYPNPTKGHLNINASLGVEVIQWYTLQGKKVQEVIPNKQENIEVELKGPPGVYFMRMQLSDGTVRNFKLIKQ